MCHSIMALSKTFTTLIYIQLGFLRYEQKNKKLTNLVVISNLYPLKRIFLGMFFCRKIAEK